MNKYLLASFSAPQRTFVRSFAHMGHQQQPEDQMFFLLSEKGHSINDGI